jgi:hypothetical protein
MTTRTSHYASTDRDDRAEQAVEPPDRGRDDADQDANTWGKALTDEEFAQALRRHLRTQDAGATR